MATLGITTDPGTDYPGSANRCLLYKVTATEDGTITKGSATVNGGGNNGKFVVYNDSSGVPGSQVAVSSGTALGSGIAVVDFTISGSITNGSTYWIGFVQDDFPSNWRYSSSGGNGLSIWFSGFSYASPPDPASAPDQQAGSYQLGAYITYTPGGGGTATLGNSKQFLMLLGLGT